MRPLLIALVAFATPLNLIADDQAPPTVLSVSREHAAACQVFPTEHPDRPFALRPEPILQRQQNTVGNSMGYTFVWLEETGRPPALCDVFYFKNHQEQRLMLNEWHSFSDRPLTVKGLGAKDVLRTFMSSPGPGVEWRKFPSADPPAKTTSRRKSQMSQLARRFQVELFDSKQQRHELRLLTTPIFPYEPKNTTDFLGGAIFAYCVETDPEVLILIEARAADSGFQWMYAPVATSIDRLFLKLDDKETWSADPPVFNAKSPHWKDYIKNVRIPVTSDVAPKP